MSIINEALKKTQDHLNYFKEKTNGAAGAPPPAGPKQTSLSGAVSVFDQPTPSVTGERGPRRPNVIIFAGIPLLCLAAWLLFIFQPKLAGFFPGAAKTLPTAQKIQRAIQPAHPPVIPRVAAPPVKPLAAPKATSSNKPVLSGIMMNQDKMTALINGEVYETGDYINGKKINKITRDSVELGEGDTITTLRLQGR